MKLSKTVIPTIVAAWGTALPMVYCANERTTILSGTKTEQGSTNHVPNLRNIHHRRALQDGVATPSSLTVADLEEVEQLDEEGVVAEDEGPVDEGYPSKSQDEGAEPSTSEDEGIKSGPTKRSCVHTDSIEGEGDFVFKCKSKMEDADSEIKDELEFTIQTRNNGLVIKVSLEQESETDEMESETENGFEVRFDKLIEYRKSGGGSSSLISRSAGSEAYEFGVDEVVAEWDMQDWSGFSPVSTRADGNLLTFSSNSLNGTADFSFTIAQADEGAISANRMKIDFTLTDFPWAGNDTYVALISHIETENDVYVDRSGDDEETEANTGEETTEPIPEAGRIADGEADVVIDLPGVYKTVGFVQAFGQYSWAKTAETSVVTTDANGRQLQAIKVIPVIASVAPGEKGSKQDIAFSFTGAGQGADWIYWDPEAGVEYSVGSDTSSGPSVRIGYFGSMLAVGAFVFTMMA